MAEKKKREMEPAKTVRFVLRCWLEESSNEVRHWQFLLIDVQANVTRKFVSLRDLTKYLDEELGKKAGKGPSEY